METIGQLCNSLGISVRQLDRETEPELLICKHHEVCSHPNCHHRWPHHPHSEIGTCGEEICLKEGVMASCVIATTA